MPPQGFAAALRQPLAECRGCIHRPDAVWHCMAAALGKVLSLNRDFPAVTFPKSRPWLAGGPGAAAETPVPGSRPRQNPFATSSKRKVRM